VVNILLTVVLVVGPGPIPSYGILGAAVGTAVGNVLAGGAYLLVLPTGRFRVRFTVDGVWDPGLAREILDIGVPQVVDRSVTAVGDVPLNAIILFFGTEANAAFHIGRRVQQYARMPNWGVSTAASTLVGTHLGRDEPDESERYARGALALGLTISVVLAVVVVAFARPLARVFVSEPVTLSLSVEWIRTLGVATVVYSVFLSLRGSLQGAGDTRWPLYGSVLGIFGFAIGFSYVVGVVLGVGLLGVYAGFVLDYAARSFVAYYRFDSGAWKHRGAPAESSVPAQ
jgi:putative MATE family efflux protein